jgi:hypothetical protein
MRAPHEGVMPDPEMYGFTSAADAPMAAAGVPLLLEG